MLIRDLYLKLKRNYDLENSDVRSLMEWLFAEPFEALIFSEKEVSEKDQINLKSSLETLQQGKPLAYIIKSQDFYKYKFYVDERVLIPRPETEYLVDLVIKKYKKNPDHLKCIMDIGAGSGCIGISLLKSFSSAYGIFVEASHEAQEVLIRNLKSLGVEASRYEILEDIGQLSQAYKKKIDLIVSNPPYIALGDKNLEESVLGYEPSQALFAGDSGLEYLKAWAFKSLDFLSFNSEVYFEFGLGQEKNLSAFAQANKWDYEVLKDQYGVNRFWKLIAREE